MLSMQPIGYVRSPYRDTQGDPEGVRREARRGRGSRDTGGIRARPQGHRRLFPPVRHLGVRPLRRMRSGGHAAERQSAARRVRDPLAAPSESDRADGGRTVGPRRSAAPRPWYRHARRHPDSRHQAVSFKCSARNGYGAAGSRKPKRARERNRSGGHASTQGSNSTRPSRSPDLCRQ